jgi:uncharacterized RDD family membrane protein YckC
VRLLHPIFVSLNSHESSYLVASVKREAEQQLIMPVPTSADSSPKSPAVLDTALRVTTPENIAFQYRLAGPFPRVLAYLLDVLVSVASYGALVYALILLFALAIVPLAENLGLGGMMQSLMEAAIGFSLIGYFIVYWFYGAIFETYFNGQTLGKRWTKLRVLTTDGHSIDGVQATLRNFFRLLDIAPVVPISTFLATEEQTTIAIPTCLFGMIMMTLSSKYQRVGDLVAGTIVINEQISRAPSLVTFSDPRVPDLAALIPAGFVVSASLSKAIADYADQRRHLPPQRVGEIASHVARPLLQRFGLPADTNYDLLLCALYYKTFA